MSCAALSAARLMTGAPMRTRESACATAREIEFVAELKDEDSITLLHVPYIGWFRVYEGQDVALPWLRSDATNYEE